MVSENDQIIDRLEELGPNQVRVLMSSGGLPTGWNVRIAEWLAVKDREEQSRSAPSQAEQIEIARAASGAAERSAAAAERSATAAELASVATVRQAVAAERANKRATIALTIAIISIVATVTGMLVVHFDTVRQMAHPG